MKKLLFLLAFVATLAKAQVNPVLYYYFDGGSPAVPNIGTGNLTGTFSSVAGRVGNAIQVTGNNMLSTGTLTTSNSFSVSFLFKPDYLFGNTRNQVLFEFGSISFRFWWPELWYFTSVTNGTTTTQDRFIVSLEGTGPMSYDYYRNKWTLFTLTYNASTGEKAIYIDGTSPAGMNNTVVQTGTIAGTSGVKAGLNTGSMNYEKMYGAFDELAIYNVCLTKDQAYQAYVDVSNGQHYSGLSQPAPLPPSVTASSDINEFPYGHTIGSANSSSVTNSVLRQFQNSPVPRYRPGHALLPNFPWVDQTYFSQLYQPGVPTTAAAIDSSVAIQSEFVQRWNYYLQVSPNVQAFRSQYSNTSTFAGRWVALANANPLWKTSAITFWDQVVPSTAGFSSDTNYIAKKGLPAAYYMRNASGQFLSSTGGVATAGWQKIITPVCPIDSIKQDGLTIKAHLQTLQTYLNRPLDMVTENMESYKKLNNTIMANDPVLVSDKASKGISSWDEYDGLARAVLFSNVYYNQFSSLPIMNGTKFLYYQVCGWDGSFTNVQNYFGKWSWMRYTQQTFTGANRYSTIDIYPRRPYNWRVGASAFRGLQCYLESRTVELFTGDTLCSPFISPGWDTDEEKAIRPGQWLGLLKIVNSLGAEFFNVGYFNETSGSFSSATPPNAPKGYVYQMMIPSYAQATVSYWENTFRHGSFLPGDVPLDQVHAGQGSSYLFWSGSPEILTTVRQDNVTTTKYVITSTIQQLSNKTGSAPIATDAKIVLAGDTLQFGTRRQGSVYVYNKTTNLFYQLDAWHEYKHPERWSKDFTLEAEVTDAGAPQLKTYNATLATNNKDFRNSYTAISYADTTTWIDSSKYYVMPRTTATHYVWFRARTRDIAHTGNIYFRCGSAVDTVLNVADTTWYWYRYNNGTATKFSYSLTGNANNVLSLIPSNKWIEIDQIMVTPNSALVLPEPAVPCSALPAVTHTGSLTFCAGGQTQLSTDVPFTTYLWNTGATTRTITVSTSGTYTVSVTDAGGCTGSASATVVVNSLPAGPSVTFSNEDYCYNGSADATCGSTSVSYLWNTGATTQSIHITQSGKYSVTVTNTSGCSATSGLYTVTFKDTVIPVITAGGDLAICFGDSVALSTGSYSVYGWYVSPGTYLSTNQTYYAKQSGIYYVDVFDADGCSGTASGVQVRSMNCLACDAARNVTLSGITKNQVKVSWSSTTKAGNYVVHMVNTRTNVDTKITVPGTTFTATYSVLTAGTVYNYYIVSKCLDGTIKSTVKKSFTTPRL